MMINCVAMIPKRDSELGKRQNRRVEVKSTICLILEMMREQRITVVVARAALHKVRVNGQRSPWDVVEQMLFALEVAQ